MSSTPTFILGRRTPTQRATVKCRAKNPTSVRYFPSPVRDLLLEPPLALRAGSCDVPPPRYRYRGGVNEGIQAARRGATSYDLLRSTCKPTWPVRRCGHVPRACGSCLRAARSARISYHLTGTCCTALAPERVTSRRLWERRLTDQSISKDHALCRIEHAIDMI